jgi:hypothetical protein
LNLQGTRRNNFKIVLFFHRFLSKDKTYGFYINGVDFRVSGVFLPYRTRTVAACAEAVVGLDIASYVDHGLPLCFVRGDRQAVYPNKSALAGA